MILLSLLLALNPTALAASSRDATVLSVLSVDNAGLSVAILAEKYALMEASAFAFFRGSNVLYWMDYGDGALFGDYGGDEQTLTFLAGDQHALNTGAFHDDHGDVVFGLNDFDEAVLGDYQLDVLRLAISLVLVARENGGFSASDEEDIVDAFAEGYLDAMADFAAGDDEADTILNASNTTGQLDNFLDDVEHDHSRADLLDRWTHKVGGVRVFDTAAVDDLEAVSSSTASAVKAAISAYRSTLTGSGTGLSSSYFKVKSVARRLHAGTGSLGVDRYLVLIEGPSSSQGDDRILDMKAQREPTGFAWMDAGLVSATEDLASGNMALRVVLAQKALGVRVDDLLGWAATSDGQVYSVRELSPWKASFPTEDLATQGAFETLAAQWGLLLAAHHARADQDWDDDVLPYDLDAEIDLRTDGDHAGFRALMRDLAIDGADQVALDYASFLAR